MTEEVRFHVTHVSPAFAVSLRGAERDSRGVAHLRWWEIELTAENRYQPDGIHMNVNGGLTLRVFTEEEAQQFKWGMVFVLPLTQPSATPSASPAE
jgi:hypothetical protein